MRIRYFRPAFVAGVLAVAAISTGRAATQADVPLPEEGIPALEGIVRSALAQSPRMVSRNLDLLTAEYQTLVSSSRLYPQVGGFVQYNIQDEARADIPDPQTTEKIFYNFSVSQALWHWGAVKAGARIGELGLQIAQHNLEGARRSMAIEVRDAYLGLIVQKKGIRNAQFGEKVASENLARQEVRFKAGEITMGQILEHRLRGDEATLNSQRSASDFQFAIKAFRRLTGMETFTEGDIPGEIPEPAQVIAPSDSSHNSSHLNSGPLLVNEVQIEQEKLVSKINEKALWPKISAVAGISQDELSYTSNLYQRYRTEILFVGVQVQWTIFDGFASRGYRLQGLNRLKQLESARSDMLESLKASADQQAAAIGFGWSAYKNAAFRLRFARERLAFEQENLARGQSSEDQVATAKAGVYQAEFSAMDTLANFYGASVRYVSTMRADPLVDGARSN